MERVLVAGATGYLGTFLLQELLSRGYPVKALVRDPQRLGNFSSQEPEIFQGEITRPESIAGCCENVDVVISTVGITRQKDGLSYMDVDYQANVNLLQEAEKSGVRKFIYVSVLNGERLRQLKICEAKERFVDVLKDSSMSSCIIRPNGFFSDMAEYFKMAQKGRAYLFGDGTLRANPIHGADLAIVCADQIDGEEVQFDVGGPQTLSQNQIAELAFSALGKPARITHLPDWLRRVILSSVKVFTSSRTYGPIEFFLSVMAMDMIAPEYGSLTLKDFFNDLAVKS